MARKDQLSLFLVQIRPKSLSKRHTQPWIGVLARREALIIENEIPFAGALWSIQGWLDICVTAERSGRWVHGCITGCLLYLHGLPLHCSCRFAWSDLLSPVYTWWTVMQDDRPLWVDRITCIWRMAQQTKKCFEIMGSKAGLLQLISEWSNFLKRRWKDFDSKLSISSPQRCHKSKTAALCCPRKIRAWDSSRGQPRQVGRDNQEHSICVHFDFVNSSASVYVGCCQSWQMRQQDKFLKKVPCSLHHCSAHLAWATISFCSTASKAACSITLPFCVLLSLADSAGESSSVTLTWASRPSHSNATPYFLASSSYLHRKTSDRKRINICQWDDTTNRAEFQALRHLRLLYDLFKLFVPLLS